MGRRATKIYALRCASAERIDFFEAFPRRRKDGRLEIFGGNVREPYLPSEVYIVPPKHARAVRSFVGDVEREIADAKAMPSRVTAEGEVMSTDYLAMRQRDGVEASLPMRIKSLVQQYELSLADESSLG